MPETIIVSIDFGTTGAAWAITKRPDEIHVITDWDSEYNTCSDRGKCPTQLEHGTINAETRWGYSIPPDKDIIRWFKLLLLDEADLPKEFVNSLYVKQAINHQKRLKTTAVELVACFLRSLWKHCQKRINDILGPGEVDSCKIHIIMTEKDTIIVCDAGGGTADLISYQVANINSFQLRECVAGEGDLCGGLFVDHNFEDLIASKLGTSSWRKLDSADKRKFMKEDWENGVKSQFAGTSRPFFVEAPDGYLPDSAMGKRKQFQTISLSQDDLLGVFSPVIDKICALVHRQEAAIDEKDLPCPKFIILVGGFGCCRYLRKRLADSYPNSTVLNPTSNQSAVRHALSHKALIKDGSHNIIGKTGKPGAFTVQSRILRMSYGFRFHEEYDPDVHLEEDKKTLCSIKWSRKVDLSKLRTEYNSVADPYHIVRYKIQVHIDGPELKITITHGRKKVADHEIKVEFR
ncbi:hypothetical protein NLG97_g2812 [Lecanicillium saksenae]|uniref:Uncharacterized protein n=1 Tax=Lecanicillium saksenae TaxID=468837 RepID=A0ACC1R0I6_9HYPO|nr:hypothetical protein NLG97_g2812 [Lecanicillium saksenae]